MSEEQKKTREDELIERARQMGVKARKATPEEKAQHRIFIGRPPVASGPRDKNKEEDARDD